MLSAISSFPGLVVNTETIQATECKLMQITSSYIIHPANGNENSASGSRTPSQRLHFVQWMTKGGVFFTETWPSKNRQAAASI